MSDTVQEFKCSLGTDAKLITAITSLVFVAALVYFCFHGPIYAKWVVVAANLVLVAVGIYNYARIVRVTAGEVVIRTPVRSITIPINQQFEAEHLPELFRKTLRVGGVGGFLGFTGRFRNKLQGEFTAYVTNKRDTVLLTSGSDKIAISPDDVEGFLSAMRPLIPASAYPQDKPWFD